MFSATGINNLKINTNKINYENLGKWCKWFAGKAGDVASLFAYFEKANELGNPDETNGLLGKPANTFENRVQSKAR